MILSFQFTYRLEMSHFKSPLEYILVKGGGGGCIRVGLFRWAKGKTTSFASWRSIDSLRPAWVVHVSWVVYFQSNTTRRAMDMCGRGFSWIFVAGNLHHLRWKWAVFCIICHCMKMITIHFFLFFKSTLHVQKKYKVFLFLFVVIGCYVLHFTIYIISVLNKWYTINFQEAWSKSEIISKM